MGTKPKLGEILVRAGVVDPDRLRAALAQQERWGRRLGQTLIEMGALTERDLVRALASQLRLPVVQLDGKQIDPEIVALVPLELAEKHGCMPLFVREEGGVRTLYLGMEDPSDVEALDDARFRSGMPIAPVMVSHSELMSAIARSYPGATELPPEVELPLHAVAPTELQLQSAAADSKSGSGPKLSDSDEIRTVSSTEMLHALVQLLIEKDIVSRDEVAACIRSMREGRGEAN